MKLKSTAIIALSLILALTGTAGAVSITSRQTAIQTALRSIGGVIVEYSVEGDGGTAHYDMEIIAKNGTEYDVRVGMVSGEIIRKKADGKSKNAGSYLNVKTDYAAALTTAQKSLPGSRVEEFELGRENGIMVYDIDLLDSAGIQYEIRVSGETGKVLSSRKENVTGTAAIARGDAEAIAAKHVGGTAVLAELDDEGSALRYEVQVVSESGALYEVRVDASTGKVLRSKMDD